MSSWQINGSGSYSTLSAALASASNNDALTTSTAWSAADTTACSTSLTGLTITCSGSAKHPGYVTNSNHYRLEVSSGSHCITLNGGGCTFDGLVIKQATTGGAGSSDEGIRLAAAGGTTTIKNTIIWSNVGTSTSDQDGIHMPPISGTVNIENSQFYGFSRSGLQPQPFSGAHTQTWNVNSCFIWDNGHDNSSGTDGGIGHQIGSSSSVTINVLNTLCLDNIRQDYSVGHGIAATWNISQSFDSDNTIASRDASAVNCLASVTLTDGTPTTGNYCAVQDVTVTPYDLRLVDHTDNDAQDYQATAVDTHTGLTIPSTDIVGTSRPNNTNYDVGPFEIAPSGSSGTMEGTSTVSGTGASTADSTGSISGSSTASGAGSALIPSAGTIDGSSTVSGVGSSSTGSTGSSDGTSTVSGIAQATHDSVGTSDGTSTVSGTAQALSDSTGTINGTSTVSGVGTSVAAGQATGTIEGTSAVSGIGASQATSTGTITGTSTVSGSGSSLSIVSSTGTISGTSAVVAFSPAEERTAGGAKPRRRHRQFANIDGVLIEVSSYKEAYELINKLNKKPKKPKKRRITFSNGPYATVYDAEAIPLREIKENLKIYHDEEDMLLLLLMAA